MFFDSESLRTQFPALSMEVAGRRAVFFDNPGGTQVPQRVIDAVTRCYKEQNANSGGLFETSRRAGEVISEARQAVADLINAPDPDCMIFGPNMTTLTFALARALEREIRPGDEALVTDLDHDANVTPWLDLAEKGAVVRVAPIRTDDCSLDMEAFARLLSERTRIVAVTHASNAVGAIPDLRRVIEMAHAAGALVFVDAVQYAPHGPIDVQSLKCDFLACSAYKFFGPHAGILWGRRELLERLRPHKVRPCPDILPWRWETGTGSHEAMAGTAAAVEYLAEVGERCGTAWHARYRADGFEGRRMMLKAAMRAITEYEQGLSRKLIEGLEAIPGVRIYGITDPSRVDERLPTVAFTWTRFMPRETAARLGEQGIFCWSGNYYALRLMESLGLESEGGAVRIGLTHYNTPAEIDRFLHTLGSLSG